MAAPTTPASLPRLARTSLGRAPWLKQPAWTSFSRGRSSSSSSAPLTPAAQTNHLWEQGIAQGDKAIGQLPPVLLQHSQGRPVPLGRRLERSAALHPVQVSAAHGPEGAVPVLLHRRLGLLDQRGGRAVPLPAAPVSTAAQNPLRVSHQVAHLHAGAAKPGVELSAPHQAAADAGAQGDHHHRVAPFGRSGPVLPGGGAVGVIAQIHRMSSSR